MCEFGDFKVSLANGTTITPRDIGGNMHNEYVCYRDQVAMFKAVEVYEQEMSHVGEYVAYAGVKEVCKNSFLHRFNA